MTFLYPNVLYALILPALLAAAAWWLWRRRSRKWEVLVSPEYRRELVNAPATWHRVLPVIFAVLASIFALLSIARPVDGYTEVKEIPKSRNILIAIDCSRSMLSKEVHEVFFNVTDGASNSGQISPLVAAENAAKLGIKIYTIAVGTEEGTLANGMVVQSEFDEPTLRKIAQLTGGEHFRATNTASFNKAFTSIGKLEKSEAKVQTVRHIEEYFMYFLVTGAALALLGLSLQVLKPAPAP